MVDTRRTQSQRKADSVLFGVLNIILHHVKTGQQNILFHFVSRIIIINFKNLNNFYGHPLSFWFLNKILQYVKTVEQTSTKLNTDIDCILD